MSNDDRSDKDEVSTSQYGDVGASDNRTDDDKPGYGRPPKSGQFKPGKSGNIKGRPKGSRNVSTMLREIADAPITTTVNGKKKRMTHTEVVVHRVLQKAMTGDDKAIRQFFALLKEHGINAPQEPEGKHGVLVIDKQPLTFEEYLTRNCNGGVPSREQVVEYRTGMNARCDELERNADERQAEADHYRQLYPNFFKDFPGNKDPNAMLEAAGRNKDGSIRRKK